MGRMIEQIILSRGLEYVGWSEAVTETDPALAKQCVCIDFTTPAAFRANYKFLAENFGAVVVGIGMPSLSYEREAIQSYYDEKYEEGKQFAYLYPGLNRVLQAAGRVIRREDDRGVIVLIDDRFRDPLYKKTVPALWKGMRFIQDPVALNENIKRFWQEGN